MNTNLLRFIGCVFAFATLVSSAHATSRTSIANGNWNNPSIWSPVGVPLPTDDSIIINTQVVFTQNIIFGQTLFQINAGASLIDQGSDTLQVAGNFAVVDGYLSVNTLFASSNSYFQNNSSIAVSNDLIQGNTLINAASGTICVGNDFITSDQLTNDGSLQCNNWINSAVATGTGRICIANNFINGQTILATLDICDATPNTTFDINSGTIASTVTYCQAAPCAPCTQPSAIAETFDAGTSVHVFPNPFSTTAQISIDPNLLMTGTTLTLEIFDVQGQLVAQQIVDQKIITLDRGTMPAGLYVYRLALNNLAYTTGKLIVQ